IVEIVQRDSTDDDVARLSVTVRSFGCDGRDGHFSAADGFGAVADGSDLGDRSVGIAAIKVIVADAAGGNGELSRVDVVLAGANLNHGAVPPVVRAGRFGHAFFEDNIGGFGNNCQCQAGGNEKGVVLRVALRR